jgi:hypothetical protein
VYNPEKKEQSQEYRKNIFPHPKKLKAQKSSSKMLASVFWTKMEFYL